MKTGDRVGALDCSAATIVSSSVFILWTLLVLAAVVLWWRRLAGALVNPLEPAALAGAAVAIVGLAAAIRFAWQGRTAAWLPRELAQVLGSSPGPHANVGQKQTAGITRTFADRWWPWTVSAAVVAIGAALSLPGTSLAGLSLFWTILAAEECWARIVRPNKARPATAAATAIPLRETVAESPTPPAPACAPPDLAFPSASVDEPDVEAIAASDVLQQMIRRRAADGSESLTGWLRVPLAANQRTANVHVAFCPPFPRTPQVAVDQLDGPTARIKKVQILPYGTRLDLKLAELSEIPVAVVLQFSALSGPPAQQSVQAAPPDDASREPEHLG